MPNEYHLQYFKKTDADIAQRMWVKGMQMRQIFATVGLPKIAKPVVNVAILGCPDARLVPHLDQMFNGIFSKPVAMTTFDLSVEHLQAASGVMQHDVTTKLPGGPYDIAYSDLLIRFIEPAKQLDVLLHSYEALSLGGMAIHIFAEEDFRPELRKEQTPGTHPVDMNALQLALNKREIFYMEVPLRIEAPVPGSEEKVVIDELALVFRKG